MIPKTSIIINAAKLLLPVREASYIGNNRGRFVEAIIKFAGGVPGEPWCASFVYYVGKKMLEDDWIFPKTRSCDVLLEFSRSKNLLTYATENPVLHPGMLFFVMKSPKDAIHVGFVDTILSRTRFTTVEGNSNDKGLRDGDGVVSNVRDYSGPTSYAFSGW